MRFWDRFPFFVALRFFRSARMDRFVSFITGISIVGVALGVGALIITLSILDGFERTISRNIVSFTAHMQVFAFQNQFLQSPDSLSQILRARYPTIAAIAPYLNKEALVHVNDRFDGVNVRGVDPRSDITPATKRLVEGKTFLQADAGGNPVIVGARFAQKHFLRLGDTVMVFAPTAGRVSLMNAKILATTIVGIYETGMGEYDESIIFFPLENAQRVFQLGNSFSGFDILLNDLSQLQNIAEDIPISMGYPFYARTMHQTYRNLFAWVELQKKPIPIILGLITIVAAVNIIGTLLMLILEKSKQIGILLTMGAKSGTIVRIFIFQGVVIGIVGTFIGNLLAFGLLLAEMHLRIIALPSTIYYMTHVPIHLSPWNFLLVSAIALSMCFVASLLPSRVASRINPLEIIRFGS